MSPTSIPPEGGHLIFIEICQKALTPLIVALGLLITAIAGLMGKRKLKDWQGKRKLNSFIYQEKEHEENQQRMKEIEGKLLDLFKQVAISTDQNGMIQTYLTEQPPICRKDMKMMLDMHEGNQDTLLQMMRGVMKENKEEIKKDLTDSRLEIKKDIADLKECVFTRITSSENKNKTEHKKIYDHLKANKQTISEALKNIAVMNVDYLDGLRKTQGSTEERILQLEKNCKD